MKNTLFLLLVCTAFSCTEKSRFELLNSDRTGITFRNTVHETDSMNVINFEYIYNGAGVGIVDLNNDGLQDIIFTGNQVASRIYLNEGDFRFTDISASFEGLDNGDWYSGVSYADINNDGWKDLYLTCTAYNDSSRRKNKFFVNQGIQENGQLLFKERAAAYGIADESYTVQSAFFDYDLDGDLDLYLLNNYVNERLSASYRAKITDGTAASNDDLYRNNGDGTFTNVTLEAGIVFEGFGLGLALGDVNKDGYPDLYISNDYVSNDLLYINQGDGTFKNEIATYLSYQTKSSMGNDMADINNDGNPDIFTLDMLPEYYHKKKQTINGFGYIYYTNDEKYGYEHQFLRNMLHLHNGFVKGEMVPYSEVGQMMGIYQSEWSWSPLFADYDNDGDKDLVIANGYPRDMTDKDWTRYKAEVYGSVASDQHVINRLPSVKAHNFAFENIGPYRFTDKSKEWFKKIPSYSYGAAFVDLDNDGDLDYVTNNLMDNAFVYRNNTMEMGGEERNFIRIQLKGTGNNTPAFGAKVELWSGGQYQFQEHFLSRGYISSVDPVVHFGLSTHRIIDSLKVTWPSGGKVSTLRNVAANQQVQMDETQSVVPPAEPSDKTGNAGLIFSKVKGVLDYSHHQKDFIDFHSYQNIIPHKFSQIGPRMEKGDLNGDGQEDIIVGATNSLPTRVYLREGKRFTETMVPGLTTRKEVPEADFAIFDVDGDGDNDVIALAGGYENREEEYIHYLYLNTSNGFVQEQLPITAFPASVVRPFDFDHDGDMDLFIGARIKVGMFPLGSDSWVLINDSGSFRKENALHFNLGMVTDALWSDYDGDGWEDLLITREWNSLVIMKNIEGQRLSSLEIPSVESRHGMWFSINVGDFDQDGDPDYIVGNLGENHRFTISDQYPLKIYALDLDLNGTLDPISTGFWKDQHDVMTEFPINYMDELVAQTNIFLKKFDGYTSFSYASIDDILDTAAMKRVDFIFYVNTAPSCILWNDEGQFRWEELPPSAQVSPIKKSIIADFNHDSYPDVLLTGNDHTFDIGTGYYDANKSLLLMSKDHQPLNEVVPPSQSGMVLQGMVESLLYMEGEVPCIIAGMNRDSAVVYTLLR